ncbi:MAG TPA: hypothetical protein VFU71_11125 [Burkholderiaceae bacterium]|nr:hypothetical protein [Burkholderiaceae bacterium]
MQVAVAHVSPKADDVWPNSGIGQLFAPALGGREAGGDLERPVERPIEWKPASSAMLSTGRSRNAGSASAWCGKLAGTALARVPPR